jgi:hypothetical protein
LFGDDHTVAVGNATCSGPAVGPASATFSAAAGKRAFVVTANDSLKLDGISLAGGDPVSGSNGGTILVEQGASFTMTDGSLSGGVATAANGGCLAAAEDATVNLFGVTVEDCTADADGGGLSFAARTTAALTDVTIQDNTSLFGYGGGIRVESADLTVVGTLPSVIQRNDCLWGGGGVVVFSDDGPANVAIGDETTITDNDAYWGGGLAAWGFENLTFVEIYGEAHVDGNRALAGGGIYVVDDVVGQATLLLENNATVDENTGGTFTGPFGVTLGGGIYSWSGYVNISGDVSISRNEADLGGGIYNLGGAVYVYGASDIDATDQSGSWATGGGVQLADNVATVNGIPGSGSAISNNGEGTFDALHMVVSGGNEDAVHLMDHSQFTANESHFNNNDRVFEVWDGSTLTVLTDFTTEEPCDVLDPLVFAPNRYCSEISNNTGELIRLVDEGASAFVQTTAIMSNNLTSSDVAVEVNDTTSLSFTTDMVGENEHGEALLPTLVEVYSGGNFVAKQNTLADVDLPTRYEAGAAGDWRRNANFDAGVGVSVIVDPAATVTGAQNIGDWNGAIVSAFPNGTPPGWVTDPARGDFHLELASAAVDICSTDGAFDIEGRDRPQPVLYWDAGAIEFPQP